MTPLQPLVEENFVDATALDRDAPLLVEVGLKPIQRPAAEGQPQALGIGQRGGDHLGALLGDVGRGTPGPRLVLQSVQSPRVEPVNPEVDGGTTDAQVPGDLAGPLSSRDGQKEPSPFDEASLGRA
jgi:hypothetical protein